MSQPRAAPPEAPKANSLAASSANGAKRLTIGLLLDDTLDSTDGVQQYVLRLGAWLSARGHEVHYLAGNTTRCDIAAHSLGRTVPVRFNGNHMHMPLPAKRRAIRQLLREQRFDVLHVQLPCIPLLAVRVLLEARRLDKRPALIGTFHIVAEARLARAGNRVLGAASYANLRRLDRVLAVSAAAQSFAQRYYGLSAKVLPNMVERRRFASARSLLRARAGQQTVMFINRLVPRKGCLTLLQAVSILCAQKDAPNFRVIIGGRGPLEAQLKNYVKAEKLGRRVRFDGFIDEADKPGYLASADLAVYPSRGGESFGVVLLEAMASGRPVVLGGDNAGYRSVLGEYPELLFPPGDPAALAAKIRYFLADKTAKRGALDWQKAYVRQFDVGEVGQRLVDIYRRFAP
jgi:phosphatidylinositol alpha-mannosyltransferase